MREFETTFIVQPEISDEACSDLCTKLDGILEKSGSRRVMLDDWGKRKLAYEIQKFQKGHYFVLYYLDEGGVVPELERSLRLEESVLRFLTVRAKDRVADVEARVAEGAELERIQKEKAAERAEREAEAERQAEAEARRRAEEAAAAGEASAADETDADTGESDADADDVPVADAEGAEPADQASDEEKE